MKNAKENKNINKKEKLDPLVIALMPESDKKMGSIAGGSLLVALALCFWASAYEVIIEDDLFVNTPTEELRATMQIIENKEQKKEDTKKKSIRENKRKKAGAGGKPKGSGRPNAVQNRGIIKMITAQTNNASAAAYDLMKNAKFAKDIDKVIKSASGLQVTGNHRIGERRGKVDGSFNQGFAEGGSGGADDLFSSLRGGTSGALSTRAIGNLRPPSMREIDMGSGNSSRSASDIMKVVRNRTPGLRHIYNKFLKKNPGFQGKVTLRFTIAPGGEVISNSIVSSTTGYAEFDNEIKNAVSRWTFNKVKSGNTTVTIPFTFSE